MINEYQILLRDFYSDPFIKIILYLKIGFSSVFNQTADLKLLASRLLRENRLRMGRKLTENLLLQLELSIL